MTGQVGGGWLSRLVAMLQALTDDQRALKKSVRRQRHAQELFQEQIIEKLGELAPVAAEQHQPEQRAAEQPQLTKAQVEGLTRLDEACEHLVRAERQARESGAADLAPQTSGEALAMLQVRVRNLQRSFGIAAIAATGKPFDDRIHRAHSTCARDDFEDGVVVEEVLPGYTRDGQVIRPALVIVNRRPPTTRQSAITENLVR